jgi:hypothetical protein
MGEKEAAKKPAPAEPEEKTDTPDLADTPPDDPASPDITPPTGPIFKP